MGVGGKQAQGEVQRVQRPDQRPCLVGSRELKPACVTAVSGERVVGGGSEVGFWGQRRDLDFHTAEVGVTGQPREQWCDLPMVLDVSLWPLKGKIGGRTTA